MVRYFDGIPFRLYKVVRTKKSAYSIAHILRNKGYYVRLVGSSKGIEIWISVNPKWFYRFGQW